MSGQRSFLLVGVRIVLLPLLFLCVKGAWADVSFYRGRQAFAHKDLSRAASFFEEARKWDPGNPGLIYFAGMNALEGGKRSNQKTMLEAAFANFDRLSREIPFYSRGWLYRGLSLEALSEPSEKTLSEERWKEIKISFEKAVELEPQNAWIHLMAGMGWLRHDSLLTTDEKEKALGSLYQSVRIRRPQTVWPYLDKPSPYLKPTLHFLWYRYGDLKLLERLTPSDFSSSRVLLELLYEEKLWKSYADVYGTYLNIQGEAYEKEYRKGRDYLAEGHPSLAYWAFRKAFWMRSWSYPQAKAGILAAQHALGELKWEEHELFKETPVQALRAILEDEDEFDDSLLPYLKPVVEETEDVYLRGVYAFRTRDYEPAKKFFETAIPESPQGRRYLAISQWGSGQKDKALAFMEKALSEENPDLRELELLRVWDPSRESSVMQKIKNTASKKIPAKRWWGGDLKNNRTHLRKRVHLQLNLLPGRAKITVFTKCDPGKGGDYCLARFLINGRPVSAAYVESRLWHPFFFSVATRGGKRWLETELLNAKKDPDPEAAPVLELGPVLVDYPELFNHSESQDNPAA
jgi:hypothetical protein